MCDLSNHDLCWIISNHGSQHQVKLSLESICTIPLLAWANNVKMRKLSQLSSNRGMPCFVHVLAPVRGHGFTLTRIQMLFLVVQRISFEILPIVRYHSHTC